MPHSFVGVVVFTKLRLTPGRTHGRQVGHKKEEGTELSTDCSQIN